MGHLPKCQLLTACLPSKTKPPPPTFSELFTQCIYSDKRALPLCLFYEYGAYLRNKHKWDHLTSPEIPKEETQNQWKILEGYKVHIKVLELWERWKSSRCKSQQGGRFCIKAIKIYSRCNGQLFFAFVRWFEFAWGCQMPWKRCSIRTEERASLCPSRLCLWQQCRLCPPLEWPKTGGVHANLGLDCSVGNLR